MEEDLAATKESPRREGKGVSRRAFIRTGLVVGGAVVASAYVKPSLQSIGVPKAFAAGTPLGQGCTPGFWKNHPQDWPTAYQPGDQYSLVFTVPAAFGGTLGGSVTLIDALNQGGGCEKALGRHSVAALLNAETLGAASFGMSSTDVITATNDALATENCGDIEGTKDSFEGLNEATCPLGGRIADP